ncbi:inhibitor of growth protein 3-like isoform X2 [Corticium candelabrum]|uniref:inhibitor of growth protein 3-like isoform X2 n=1 Tax=Corticium candelabrum TaxID=121492 RepID=UPI002E258AA9|nr:inhibitor of growth protein 3-like isoform X2 [Corticium candelabrum]
MLYLEDFLEMIEQLPQDLRDRFTEIRELDLKVQNASDTMDGHFRSFFALAKKNKPEWREEQFKHIKEDYKKILDEAEEKVVLANQMHDLVERYLKKLDIELSKFKLELEADSAGITEMLEQRSLQLDQTPVPSPVSQPSHSHYHHHHSHKRKASSLGDNHYTRGYGSNYHSSPPSPNGGSSSYYNGVGYSGTAPAQNQYSQHYPSKMARTSSYVVSIPQDESSPVTPGSQHAMQRQVSSSAGIQDSHGRRGSGTLKLAYTTVSQAEPVRSHSVVGTIGSISSVGGGGASTVTASGILATVPIGTTEMKPHRKKSHSRTVSSTADFAITGSAPATPSAQYGAPDIPANDGATTTVLPMSTGRGDLSSRVVEGSAPVQEIAAAWTEEIDPNEPRYCLCNQYSYGEMVACDNLECPIEWFHYGCVGITEPPKGKWYCPRCIQARRRGRNR